MRTIRLYTYLFSYMLSKLNTINKAHTEFMNGNREEAVKKIHKLAFPAMRKILKIAGADITVKGIENISRDETYLFVGNHQGNMDIPLLYVSSPFSMGFVAKKEMRNIPLLGKVMEARGCLFIDRDNPRNAIKTIGEGIELLKSGHSLALFPEGTRSKSSKIGEFKAGGLKMAMKSGVKIIPVTINNSYSLMEKHNGKVTPADIQIVFSEPVDVSKYKDAVALTNDVKAIIESNLISD